MLRLSIAFPVLKVRHDLVTHDTTGPLAKDAAEAKGEKGCPERNDVHAVGRFLEFLRKDDCHAHGPGEDGAVVDGR